MSRGCLRTILLLAGCSAILAGCSAAGGTNAQGSGGSSASSNGGSAGAGASSGGGIDAGLGGASGAAGTGGGISSGASGGGTGRCISSNPDISGCPCSKVGQTRPCYPSTVDQATRNVGVCRDGTQTCTPSGEFPQWSACTGAVTPTQEKCNDGADDDCNGKAGCADPSCATYPGCTTTGCTPGQTRPCYTGPAGTLGVGTCKAGVQTCGSNRQWGSACTGEVLPTKEVCTDSKDHNCNHLPGCLDLFACVLNPACQPQCHPDPGCSCPSGSGEQATCPNGTYGLTKSSGPLQPGIVECCPCTANDCGQPGCCGESVCQGNSLCSGYQCNSLPADCNGQVGFDCDDFPEDCDVHCCKCTQCPP